MLLQIVAGREEMPRLIVEEPMLPDDIDVPDPIEILDVEDPETLLEELDAADYPFPFLWGNNNNAFDY
jgi:hypothetical protein